jgi:hypothetical protein
MINKRILTIALVSLVTLSACNGSNDTNSVSNENKEPVEVIEEKVIIEDNKNLVKLQNLQRMNSALQETIGTAIFYHEQGIYDERDIRNVGAFGCSTPSSKFTQALEVVDLNLVNDNINNLYKKMFASVEEMGYKCIFFTPSLAAGKDLSSVSLEIYLTLLDASAQLSTIEELIDSELTLVLAS